MCRCKAGFFEIPKANAGVNGTAPYDCAECNADWANCSAVGQSIETLVLLPDWYRVSNKSTQEAYQCPTPGTCLGGSDTSNQCREGHEGVLCQTCSKDWFRPGGVQINTCERCSTDENGPVVAIALAVSLPLSALVAMIWLAWRVQRMQTRAMVDGQRDDSRMGRCVLSCMERLRRRSDSGGPKIRILVTLSQLIKGSGFVFAINFPPFFSALTQWLGSIVEVNLPNLLPIDCIERLSYFAELLFRTAIPLVLYLFLLGFAAVMRRLGRQPVDETTVELESIRKRRKRLPCPSPCPGGRSYRRKRSAAKKEEKSLPLFLASIASRAAFIELFLGAIWQIEHALDLPLLSSPCLFARLRQYPLAPLHCARTFQSSQWRAWRRSSTLSATASTRAMAR